MIDIKSYMDAFLEALCNTFENNIWFVGLQGSYARGEATESSDIDIVLILNKLSAEDIKAYNKMLDTLPHRELICGFLSGKDELLNWESSDLFQFYHDTIPIKGSLEEILPLLNSVAIERAIKIGVCNIYHGCVHNMLHEKSEDILKGLYKSACFVIQAIYYKQSGKYICSKDELLEVVSSDEQVILQAFLRFKSGNIVEFDKTSEALFVWTQTWISKV